jgi:dihydroneopterin aldolase
MSAIIEIKGLEVPGRHGVEEEERQREQPFLYDLELELLEPGADRIEDTVDYREVVSCVRAVSGSRQFQLLEAMAATVAEALLAQFELEGVRVRVRKPQVELEAPAAWTAATVARRRP